MTLKEAIVYGESYTSITLDQLIEEQKAEGLLWAHAEDSGCESCYVEVAKWSHMRNRWERYCFCKCLDHRLPDMPDASDEDTATETARRINEPCWYAEHAKVVACFHNYADPPTGFEKGKKLRLAAQQYVQHGYLVPGSDAVHGSNHICTMKGAVVTSTGYVGDRPLCVLAQNEDETFAWIKIENLKPVEDQSESTNQAMGVTVSE